MGDSNPATISSDISESIRSVLLGGIDDHTSTKCATNKSDPNRATLISQRRAPKREGFRGEIEDLTPTSRTHTRLLPTEIR